MAGTRSVEGAKTMKKKTWLAGSLAVAATGALTVAITLPSEAATTPVASGVYTLASAASGKCVDVAGASTASSALLVQLACSTSATNQRWQAVQQNSGQFQLKNGNSG